MDIDKNIKYFKNISYPEYSNSVTSTREVTRQINGGKDLLLLDLSLSQRDRIDKKIIQIISGELLNIGKYSHSQNSELLRLLSKANHISKNNIIITSGCDGALRVISQLLITKNVKVCIPIPSFGRYEYYTKLNKGKIYFFYNNKFPYNTNVIDLAKFLEEKNIDVLFLANPNNPTGIYLKQSAIVYILNRFRGYTIIDESLINPNTISTAKLIKNFPNLIVVKSFSKFYGLAGARIGYLMAHDKLIKPLRNLVSPFEVSSIALSLAITVLKDKKLVEIDAKIIKEQLKKLIAISKRKHNIKISPSKSSLALIQYTGKESLFDLLLKRGIKTVNGEDFRGLKNTNTVRISIKDKDSIDYLISEIEKI